MAQNRKTRTVRRERSDRDSHLILQDSRELLAAPENRETPRLFIAATRQNEGKTTTCLGLFGALQTCYSHVAYIKPIGQRFIDVDGVKIDEDSFLLNSIYPVDAPLEAMSPIAIDSDFTRRYLRDPDNHRKLLVDRICRAFDRTGFQKDMVIIEGSGHAGVGAVFDMSNAEVARILGAKAIIISSGGIGRPVDEIALNKSLFDQCGVEVVGAILNKVLPDKIDVVKEFAGLGLKRLGVPLLGVIPVNEQLSAPNLSQIVAEIRGRWLNGLDCGLLRRVRRVVVGAMTARGIIDGFQDGMLIITPGDRDDIILATLAACESGKGRMVSGLILTREIKPHPRLLELLAKTEIPVVMSSEESYAVASRINAMTIKTQPQDSDKIPVIRKMVLENVSLDLIRETVER